MKEQPCPRCRAQTLTGTEDVRACALPYRLDPAPLDAAGELAALRAGRRTWTVRQNGQVLSRSVRAIHTVAGCAGRQQVHADHACRKGE